MVWRPGAFRSDHRVPLTQRPVAVCERSWAFHSSRRTWSVARDARRQTWNGSKQIWVSGIASRIARWYSPLMSIETARIELPPRIARDRPGPPRRVERPRALTHGDRPLGQGHAVVAPEGARTPDHRPARHALRGPARQPRALPRLPAARGAQVALPPRRPRARAGAPRRLARLGQPLPTPALRPARTHPAHPPRRHPRGDPPRALQRPPRGPQQQDPPDQPPQLRLSLRRRPDRVGLPLLHRHHDRAAPLTSPPNRPERPYVVPLGVGSGVDVGVGVGSGVGTKSGSKVVIAS